MMHVLLFAGHGGIFHHFLTTYLLYIKIYDFHIVLNIYYLQDLRAYMSFWSTPLDTRDIGNTTVLEIEAWLLFYQEVL